MGMIAVCDGCGKQEPAACHNGNWFKPGDWFERTPLVDGKQQRNLTACSRSCINVVADNDREAGGDGLSVVLPL